MNTPWNQPPTNKNGSDHTKAPSSGGLLKSYKQQVQSGNQMSQGDHQSQMGQPPTGGFRQPLPTNPPGTPGQVPSGHFLQNPLGRGVLSHTLNMVRRWSGKMAAVAGYAPQPPAPYMERYRVPSQPGISQGLPMLPSERWKRSSALRVTTQMRQRRVRSEKTRSNRQIIWLTVVLSFLVIGSASGIFYGYFYLVNQKPPDLPLAGCNNGPSSQAPQSSRIYDRDGQLLGMVHSDNPSTLVTYDAIPQVMQDAMIAAEDPSFWSNNGVDPQGIVRAMVQYVGAGGKVQSGGSTITQQVVKNLSGNNQGSLDRKVAEAAQAIQLTSEYSKADILTAYFNFAPFANASVGIEAAAEDYFNLWPTKLDLGSGKFALGITQLDVDTKTGNKDPLLGLARASMLAAIPNNPTEFDPTLGDAYKNRMLGRQDYVLKAMMANNMKVEGLGPVTPDIITQAEDLTTKMTFSGKPPTTIAPHFVDWVTGELALSLGNGDYAAGALVLASGGFSIRTTLNSTLEQYAEASIKRHLTQVDHQYFPYEYDTTLNTAFNVNDSSAVVLNVHTGEILAMVGSADYYNTDPRVGGQANAAAGGPGTQEGSSFKPFVYATSFQLGWYPGMILPDNSTYVPNGQASTVGLSIKDDFHPPDFNKPDGSGKMDTTIRFGTDVSWNIPAVKAGAYVGTTDDGLLMTNLKRMGLSHINDLVPSSPLGTSNATVLEMTGAYQTFANAGTHIPPQPILDIWQSCRSIYHYDPANPVQVPVFSPEVAYLMTSVLIDQPTRRAEFVDDPDLSFMLQFPDCRTNPECSHQLAVKTGTTDKVVNGVDMVGDNWTVGYTPDIAVGVWSGNANGEALKPGTVGVTGAAPIWEDIVSAASGYCDLKPDRFQLLACPTNPDQTPLMPQNLGIQNPQVKFTMPNDVHKVSLNTYNGLSGGGNLDYVIGGMEPSSAGMQPQSGGDNKNGQNGQSGTGGNNGNKGPNGNNGPYPQPPTPVPIR
jgi:membrane peptidoglycan carboxypeptidase